MWSRPLVITIPRKVHCIHAIIFPNVQRERRTHLYPLRRDDFLKRVFAFPDTTHCGEIAPAVVWRLLIGVGDEHALFHEHAFSWLPLCVSPDARERADAGARASFGNSVRRARGLDLASRMGLHLSVARMDYRKRTRACRKDAPRPYLRHLGAEGSVQALCDIERGLASRARELSLRRRAFRAAWRAGNRVDDTVPSLCPTHRSRELADTKGGARAAGARRIRGTARFSFAQAPLDPLRGLARIRLACDDDGNNTGHCVPAAPLDRAALALSPLLHHRFYRIPPGLLRAAGSWGISLRGMVVHRRNLIRHHLAARRRSRTSLFPRAACAQPSLPLASLGGALAVFLPTHLLRRRPRHASCGHYRAPHPQ